MNRTLTALFVLAPSMLLAACGGTVDGGTGYTKEEARALGGVDGQGNDICAAEGWYGDRTCDDFCQKADPDCPVSNQCPDASDPAVHYVSTDYSACMAADYACPPNQIPFDLPDCGCGCIDQQNPGKQCGGLAGLACDDGFFCNYAPDAMCGAADQMGTCEPEPQACPEYYGPVCGCDGQTYDNPCFANAAGVAVASDGACNGGGKMCGGIAGIQCAPGEFCSYTLDAMCGAGDMAGTCAPVPEACDTVYDPVCGCDGQTYSNECAANAAGVSVASKGACNSGGKMCGGFGGFQCAAGEFCDYALDAMCGAGDMAGTCAPIPQSCTANYDPVCGCDGQTYSNECVANAAGVSIASKGACAAFK